MQPIDNFKDTSPMRPLSTNPNTMKVNSEKKIAKDTRSLYPRSPIYNKQPVQTRKKATSSDKKTQNQ